MIYSCVKIIEQSIETCAKTASISLKYFRLGKDSPKLKVYSNYSFANMDKTSQLG